MKTLTPFGDHGLILAYVQDGQGRRLVACVAERGLAKAVGTVAISRAEARAAAAVLTALAEELPE